MTALTFDRNRESWENSIGMVKETRLSPRA